MRFPSRLIQGAPRWLVLALALSVLGFGGACEDKHIGRLCELGVSAVDGGTSGATATIASPALECPSRICILPGATRDPEGTQALCTATCDSNDDCEDGETVNMSAKGDPHCKRGFVCMWPTTVGAFCCQKMCVCRDFVTEPMGGFKKPPVCEAPSTCANVR
jgi:hypothetical protein